MEMKCKVQIGNTDYSLNLKKGISFSTIFSNANFVKAFFAPDVHIEAVKMENFICSTEDGGILNFKNLFINPHGNGTHTECVGHIAKETYYIKDCLKDSFVLGKLITIAPEKLNNDFVITAKQVKNITLPIGCTCILIRTLPNETKDKLKDWSGTNPPYIHHEAMKILLEKGVEHFMIDVPSVDRENDEGKLLAHKTFWNYPSSEVRENCTITEMIYAPNKIKDGIYMVNIQTLPLELDASPSNIIIYPLKK
ncbi:MAG: cyclase family protein [Chitinophagales bacterium]|nr:cyclase family protein [Chitinophagales bacterium]